MFTLAIDSQLQTAKDGTEAEADDGDASSSSSSFYPLHPSALAKTLPVYGMLGWLNPLLLSRKTKAEQKKS